MDHSRKKEKKPKVVNGRRVYFNQGLFSISLNCLCLELPDVSFTDCQPVPTSLTKTSVDCLCYCKSCSITPMSFLLLLFQFSHVLSCFVQGMNNVQVPLNLKLWRTVGCHELLASLGFDLIGVGKDEVMLRSGKANSRRAVQCTVQALCALTGEIIILYFLPLITRRVVDSRLFPTLLTKMYQLLAAGVSLSQSGPP